MKRVTCVAVLALVFASAVMSFPETARDVRAATADSLVGGVAWHDVNRDGVRDVGEPPMPGVTIVLKTAQHQEVGRRTTLGDGSYEFDSLESGGYELTKEDVQGYSCTFPPAGSHNFYLPSGQQLRVFDFGFAIVATRTPTPSATPTGTVTPVRTPTQTTTPTITPIPSATSTPTRTPVWSPTPTSTATETRTPTPTATLTPSPTATTTAAGTFEDPIPVACGGRYGGTTDGHLARTHEYGPCGLGMWAPEVVHAIQLSEHLDYLSITLDAVADLTVFVLSSTNPGDCLGAGGSVFLPDLSPATYYIVVDGTEVGAFSVEVNCFPMPGGTATPTVSPTGFTLTPTASPTGFTPTPTSSPTGALSPTATRSATETPGGPSTIYLPMLFKAPLEILIDCGADSVYTDTLGRRWQKDGAYTAGWWGYQGASSTYTTGRDIINTSDPRLYQTTRLGNAFGYKFDVPSGRYEVELRFAEVWWGSAGRRVFDVIIEGQTVRDNYDIYAAAGGRYIAQVEMFTTWVTDGHLNIDLDTVRDLALINAVRVAGIE